MINIHTNLMRLFIGTLCGLQTSFFFSRDKRRVTLSPEFDL